MMDEKKVAHSGKLRAADGNFAVVGAGNPFGEKWVQRPVARNDA